MKEYRRQTKDLSKNYGPVRALNGVNLTLESGLPIGLVGPNGAGKTTLFALLCGFLKPDDGQISILGHQPNDAALRGRVAILPQDANLLKGVPIAKQLSFFARLQGFGKKDANDEAMRVLKLVELDDVANRIPESLSHGMYKRVNIAQAFIGKPEIILLDEPTAGLDPATARQIKNQIRKHAQDHTFIVSSHNMELIEDLCQSVLVLKKGQLVSQKRIADLTTRSNVIRIKLEADPPADIANAFSDITNITHIDIGETGEHSLIFYFTDQPGQNDQLTEIEILRCLAQTGLKYREIQRGESLEKSITNITS